MTKKQFLSQAFYIDNQINTTREEIQRLRDMLQDITSHLKDDCVQQSKKADKVGEIVASIVDLEEEYLADVENLLITKKVIHETIATVERTDLRLLLEMRYIHFHKWERIACDLNYGWRHVHKLHALALEKMALNGTLICDMM